MIRIEDEHGSGVLDFVIEIIRLLGVSHFFSQSQDFLEIRIALKRAGDLLNPIRLVGLNSPLGLKNRQFLFDFGKSCFKVCLTFSFLLL